MRPWLIAAVVVAACSSSTDIDSSLLEYRAPVAGSFAEVATYTNVGGPGQCTIFSTLSGTVSVKLQKQGDLSGAEAGVDLTERVVGASAKPGCSSSHEVRPFGEWTTTIQGTLPQISFSITKSSNAQQTTISFNGTLVNNVVSGTLRYTRNTTLPNGTSVGTTDFPLSFTLTSPQPAALNGTWTGTLAFRLTDRDTTRRTTLALTQSGTSVTGQLQFEGGETDSVEGTVAGSTLAITVTPRPVGDGCDRQSFGITFVIESNRLRATNATGIACEMGGLTLREFASAQGTLTR